MGKAIRDYPATGFALQSIVPDREGRLQGLLQIAGIQQLAFAVGSVTPQARKTVGL